ncbi:hypothetical protein [Moorena bouillonii]|uniref:hypothetical protein n=1 Tax=Moorena bouillonii TaxID=207920 RepID=UPI00117C0071|nr:hypothetical protein [Moorena bouillonii]
MQSLMGETTAVAHGGDPQDRTASPRPRCIAFCPPYKFPTPYSLLPTPFAKAVDNWRKRSLTSKFTS